MYAVVKATTEQHSLPPHTIKLKTQKHGFCLTGFLTAIIPVWAVSSKKNLSD